MLVAFDDKMEFNKFELFGIGVKIQFFRDISCCQNSFFLEFPLLFAEPLLTYSSLLQTIW